MALKQVQNYYKQVEKLYFELASELKEMEDDFKKGECTEEELQNLLIPVNNIKENYQRLAYIMFLFYQPNKEKKKDKYFKQNKGLAKYFDKNCLTIEQEIEREKDALKTFKQAIKKKFWKYLNYGGAVLTEYPYNSYIR